MIFSAPMSYVLRWRFKEFLRSFFSRSIKDDYSIGLSDVEPANRILDNVAREQYKPVIELMFRLIPKTMERKIPEANVQQAFVVDAVRKFSRNISAPRILCVGCYEDSAAETLERLGYPIRGIDPVLNCDLSKFYSKNRMRRYDIIFSTSVIEHVYDDELFISQMAELLAPGGVAILTCDFNDKYKSGDLLPAEDYRLYTQRDFVERLLPQASGCELIGTPNWDCEKPDFSYAGCNYTFASLLLRKKV